MPPPREVLSKPVIEKIRWLLGPHAVGEVESGFRSISNPFNFHWEHTRPAPTSISPARFNIPEFLESRQTIEFLGFEQPTADLIWDKFRTSSIKSRMEDQELLWCVIQYVGWIETKANQDGCFDQQKIKERMGFHWGTTLFYIDTEIPMTPYIITDNRVVNWIIPRIARRYDFIRQMDERIDSLSMITWSMESVPQVLAPHVPEDPYAKNDAGSTCKRQNSAANDFEDNSPGKRQYLGVKRLTESSVHALQYSDVGYVARSSNPSETAETLEAAETEKNVGIPYGKTVETPYRY